MVFGFLAQASHNRAGEITYVQIDSLTIEATITLYTKTSSVQADKDSILVDWGDGTSNFVKRTNNGGNGLPLGNNVKYNEYSMKHTYPGRNTYTICTVDPNRVAQIQNLNFPNSENIRFSIQTTFTFTNSTFDGFNSSVRLLQSPIDIACINKTFIHKPNAFEPDGDSLAFELTMPYKNCEEFADDYKLPDEILPLENNFFFDETDGTIIWDSPKKAGEYNVAFLVKEFRDGQLINVMIRDMQIFVLECDNEPPQIEAPDEICVVAGEVVEFDVTITDPDVGQLVQTSATGGPFLTLPNSATFSATNEYLEPPYNVTFRWETRCEDIRNEPYQIVIRAVDDFFILAGSTAGLADLHDVKITVVGPSPENLTAESESNKIILEWDRPYICEDTDNDFFQGFSIWRSEQSIDIELDTCNPGIENKGYFEISGPVRDTLISTYFYEDEEVEKGKTYCYRIVAEFAQISAAGFPYNFVQSLVSNEICIQLPQDIPLLTKVSINSTNASNGSIDIAWIPPDPVQLDTIENPGPYRYQLQRAETITGSNFVDVPGASFSTNFISEVEEFSFQDQGLNTQDLGYTYRVAFFTQGGQTFYDNSPTSSSTYLSIISSDQVNILSWDYNTSWVNTDFYIHRYDPIDMNFVLIDSTQTNHYDDEPLENGTEYCYYVETKGSYQTDAIPLILLNLSNEACGIPLDTIPPCTPPLIVSNACEEADENTPEEDFENTLEWERVDIICEKSDDIAAYRIYFKFNLDDEFVLLEEITDIQVIRFTHKPETGLTACYAISSVDSLGNESPFSEFNCIEDCPSYLLPNAFTPNGDGSNDVFTPILNRFVTRVNFQVFNEWGQKVFTTNDPQILWNGTNQRGAKLSDGVYYYTCEIFKNTSTSEDVSFDFLKGYIQILKSE